MDQLNVILYTVKILNNLLLLILQVIETTCGVAR